MHLTKMQSIFYLALIFFFFCHYCFSGGYNCVQLHYYFLFLFCFGSITDCTQQIQLFVQSTASEFCLLVTVSVF